MKKFGTALVCAALAAAACKGENKDRSSAPTPAGSAAPAAVEAAATPPAPPAPAEAAADAAVAPDAAAAPDATGPLKVTYRPPKVGDIIETTFQQHTEGVMLLSNQKDPLVQHREEVRTAEVLAVKGDAVTKLKVTFGKVVSYRKMGFQVLKDQTPLEGKTFLVTAPGGKITITDKDGNLVSGDTFRELRSIFVGQVGKPDPRKPFFTGRTFRKGEGIVLSPEEMKAFALPSDESVKPTRMTVTWVGQEGDVATFAITSLMTGKQGPMTMTFDVKATLKLEVSTMRPLALEDEAQLRGTGSMELEAKMTGSEIYAYPSK